MKISQTSVADVEKLLYQEANFLDKSDLDSWLELYTQDGTYWMPVTPDQEDPLNHISLFYDDRTIMEIRRRNLNHPRAASKDLPIRSSHIIGNVQIVQQHDDELTATSNFHCAVYSNNQQLLYAGTYKHDLVAINGELKIKNKRVDIINCDDALGCILIYL